MSADRLREAYAENVRANTPLNRDNCPSPEVLERLAQGQQADDKNPDINALEHVLSCSYCRPEFELLRTVAVSAEKSGIIEPVRRVRTQSFRGRNGTRMLIAATLLIAATFGREAWRRLRLSDSDVVRGDSNDVMLISPLSPGGSDALNVESARRFTWHRVEGASAYSLEILDTKSALLVSRISPDTSIVLNDEETSKILAAATIDWMVTAKRGDGNERRSPLTRVRVVR